MSIRLRRPTVVALALAACVSPPPPPASPKNIERHLLLREVYTAVVRQVRTVANLEENAEQRLRAPVERHDHVATGEEGMSDPSRCRAVLAEHELFLAHLSEQQVPRTADELAEATRILEQRFDELRASITLDMVIYQALIPYDGPTWDGRVVSRAPFGLWTIRLDDPTAPEHAFPLAFAIHDGKTYKSEMVGFVRRGSTVLALEFDLVPAQSVRIGDFASNTIGRW